MIYLFTFLIKAIYMQKLWIVPKTKKNKEYDSVPQRGREEEEERRGEGWLGGGTMTVVVATKREGDELRREGGKRKRGGQGFSTSPYDSAS